MQKEDLTLKTQQELESLYVIHSYGRKAVEFVEGHGMVLLDSAGKEYLDFLAGIAVVCLGHSHPVVVEAIQAQAAKLMQTSNYFFAEGRGELARSISDLLSLGRLANSDSEREQAQTYCTFFANSGTEANEGAFKLARKYAAMQGSDARGILSLKHSFHGRTFAALAATGQTSKQEAFEPLPAGFLHTELGDIEALQKTLDAKDVRKDVGGICAVIVECVQGESGIWPIGDSFAKALSEICKERNILLIVDEVQTGFYRCGSNPFAFQNYDIQPDIVTMAKGIASGFPMGAFAAKAEIAQAFAPGDHGSTFGGNPLAIATARATISELCRLNIGDSVAEVGAYMSERLLELPLISSVRGMGLMLGASLEHEVAAKVVDMGLKHGLVLNAPTSNILRFVPPLICSKSDVDEMILRLALVLKELAAEIKEAANEVANKNGS